MTDAERRELVKYLRIYPSNLAKRAADEIEWLAKINRELCLGWEQAERERNEALEELQLWKLQG